MFEASGRVDGMIAWGENRSRFSGNASAEIRIVRDGKTPLEIRDLVITGIVIDIPSAGIVIRGIAIDHVGAG